MMLQTIVAAHVPHSDSPPRLATYILSALLLSALNVVTCVLVIHAADREFARPYAPPPNPLARTVRLLARLLDARAVQKSASCARVGTLEELSCGGATASSAVVLAGVSSYGLREAASVCLEQVPAVSRRTRHARAHAHMKRARHEALSRLVTTSTGPVISTAAGAPSASSANCDDGGHVLMHADNVGAAVGAADSDTPFGGTKAQIIKSSSSTSVPVAATAVSWTTVSDVLNRLFGLVNLALLLLVMAIFLFPVML